MKSIATFYRGIPTSTRIFGTTVLLAAVILLAATLPVSADAWSTFTTIFLGIFIEAAPFLLLGTLASGLVEVFINQDIIRRVTPGSPILAALMGSMMGFVFPVCECGVVPLVRRLFRKGLPIPMGVAFLFSAPVINPIVLLSTASAFGFGRMLLLRLGFTFLIAALLGLIFSAVQQPWDILRPTAWITADTASLQNDDHPDHDHEHHPDHDHNHAHDAAGKSLTHKLTQVLQVTLDEFFEMGRYLVLGGLVAAGMQTFIPQSILLNVGSGPVLSVLVMMTLAVILSICSTVDSFVALGFTGIFSTGSVLAFLLYGPMVDIKSTLMFLRVFRPRAVVYLVTIPFLLVLLIGISLNYFTAW